MDFNANNILNEIFYSLKRLENYVIKNKFMGYELDDFLASPFTKLLSFGNLFIKRIFIQIGKKLPINIRPILLIKKMESNKARAFFAEGAAILYSVTRKEDYKNLVKKHLIFLLNNYNKNFNGFSWGNHFDFASRGGFFPKYLPTIVWTAKVADAAYRISYIIPEIKDICYKIILGASDFILNDLERIEDESGFCFAYAPGLLNPIHNSNLLGASTLAKAFQITKDEKYIPVIKASINWSISKINKDGSLYYGEGSKYKWIDNFHTAYVIDSLVDIYEIDKTFIDFEIIDKIFNFWINNFFTKEGKCKYYHNKLYPIDIQAIAQSIETLSKMTKYYPTINELLIKVVLWAIKNMQNKDGSFAYQINRFWKNKIPYIHWGQSTMYCALAYAIYAIKTMIRKQQ